VLTIANRRALSNPLLNFAVAECSNFTRFMI
jgi:hypothetical protein